LAVWRMVSLTVTNSPRDCMITLALKRPRESATGRACLGGPLLLQADLGGD
jgi:hypothetical protein